MADADEREKKKRRRGSLRNDLEGYYKLSGPYNARVIFMRTRIVIHYDRALLWAYTLFRIFFSLSLTLRVVPAELRQPLFDLGIRLLSKLHVYERCPVL